MRNRPQKHAEAFAGLDVSAGEISVARLPRREGTPAVASFANNASGHKALLAHLLQGVERIRVCLEASGNYSLDVALVLHARSRIQVSLVNPRRARRLIAKDSELDRRFRLMMTVPGVAEVSALQILGELAALPESLDARQWVAFSGLDPSEFSSGTSVEKRPRISRGGSRHLRRALYMPALVALRREPHLRSFYERLVNRGKARLQAVVAVMRKLLHALFAMFRTNQIYDGTKLCSAQPAWCA